MIIMRNVHICQCHLVLHSSPSYHFTMFKNDFVCIARQHYVAEGARQSLRKIKKPIKLVFSPQNDQINCFDSCFFLSVCFVFFLGLLGFELETPTANTESTLRGLRLAPALPLTEIEQGSVTHLLVTFSCVTNWFHSCLRVHLFACFCRPPATLQWSETQTLGSDSCSECRFLSLILLFSHTLCCGISMSVICARPLLWMLCM